MSNTLIINKLQELAKWSADKPIWMQLCLHKLYTQSSLSDADYTELLNIVKSEVKKEATFVEEARLFKSIDFSTQKTNTSSVQIKRIYDLNNVNALSEESSMSFHPTGLTVVYGDNGTGKSGYARILKKACRARHVCEITPNVYRQDNAQPDATIEFLLNGTADAVKMSSGSNSALNSVSVFDSECAPIYVEKENKVAYKPLPLELLSRLVECSIKIKEILQKEKQALPKEFVKNDSITFVGNTTAKNRFASISHTSKYEELELFFTLTEEEERRIASLADILKGDPGKEKAKTSASITALTSLEIKLKNLQDKYSNASIAEYINFHKKVETLKIAQKKLVEDLKNSSVIDGVGEAAWQTLWNAAKEYSTNIAYPKKEFPNIDRGSKCVLCQQDLDDEASSRLTTFKEFVENSISKDLKATQKLISEKRKTFESDTMGEERLVESEAFLKLHIQDEPTVQHLIEFRKKISTYAQELSSTSIPDESIMKVVEYNIDMLNSALKSLAARVEALNKSSNAAEWKKLEDELNELSDRSKVLPFLPAIKNEIERLKTQHLLEESTSLLNMQAVTRKSSSIADDLLTGMLRDRFLEEINFFNPYLKKVELVKSRGTAGESLFALRLVRKPEANVGSILSEGEHRVIALASFLAELSTDESNSGIIFDDPVSSLDHNHRDRIAERLVDESINRQVIIFTHDIVFLLALHSYAKGKSEINFRTVNRGRDYAGIIENSLPHKAKPVSDVITTLEKRIKNERILFDLGKIDDWESKASDIVERLRQSWERAVEEVISPVLSRFSHKVNTKGFKLLSAITEADHDEMRNAYGRCSVLIHDESPAKSSPPVHPDKIQSEIECLKNWVQKIIDEQKKVEKTL